MNAPKHAHKRKFIHSDIIDSHMDDLKPYTLENAPAQNSIPFDACDISEFVALNEIIDFCLVPICC